MLLREMLTRRETALVVEKGLTVGGKSLVEHLEATHHAQALDWVKEQIKPKNHEITEKDILQIHEIILKEKRYTLMEIKEKFIDCAIT